MVVRNVFLALFLCSWCIAVGGWLYSARFHYPVSFGWVRDEPRKSEYRAKAWRGGGVFVAAWCFGFVLGLVGNHVGLWR